MSGRDPRVRWIKNERFFEAETNPSPGPHLSMR
jgi:hypothetical protein